MVQLLPSLLALLQLRLQEKSKGEGSSPSKRVSKMFTFRVEAEDGKRKKRTRRPDDDDCESGPLMHA